MSLTPLHRYFSEVLGVFVSRGWLHESGVALGNHLQPAWEDLGSQIRSAEVLNLDEPGFGRKDWDWIWVALSARTALFHFNDTRGARALTSLLPEDFKGVIGADRYGAYRAMKSAIRQFCWAHLRREFVALSEAQKPDLAALGKRLLAEQEEVFALVGLALTSLGATLSVCQGPISGHSKLELLWNKFKRRGLECHLQSS